MANKRKSAAELAFAQRMSDPGPFGIDANDEFKETTNERARREAAEQKRKLREDKTKG